MYIYKYIYIYREREREREEIRKREIERVRANLKRINVLVRIKDPQSRYYGEEGRWREGVEGRRGREQLDLVSSSTSAKTRNR